MPDIDAKLLHGQACSHWLSTATAPAKMSNFLSLPLEIRRMIYTHALVVGYIYPYFETQNINYHCWGGDFNLPQFRYTHHESGDVYDVPNVNLLQICRLVCQEASPILYSKNQILLPVLDLTLKFFSRCLNTPERRSWIKSVALYLVSEDMYEYERKIVFDANCGKLRTSMTAPPYCGESCNELLQEGLVDWSRDLHLAYKRHLTTVIWPRKVAPLLEHLTLDFLELWMDYAHCHSECCDMTKSALSAFTPGFAKGFPKQVNIFGYSKHFCTASQCIPYDCGCGVRCRSAAVKERMKLWTQQRDKSSYSVKEGFHLMNQVFQWVVEEEDENGNW